MPASHSPANRKLKTFLGALAAAALLAAALSIGAPSASAGGGIGVKQPGEQSAGEKKKYKKIWRKTSKRQKRWANRTARCESGRNPKAIGGGGTYRGAFQFRKDTWRRAPKSPGGDPIRYTYKTQAVVAVALKRRDGAHHWPSCGRR